MSRGPGYTPPPGWAATRQRILNRDAHTCYICGGQATTPDHIVPVSQGGSHEDSNLAAICAPCHDPKTESERRQALAHRRSIVSKNRTKEQHPGQLSRHNKPTTP